MLIEEVEAECRRLAAHYGYDLDVPVIVNPRLKTTQGRVKFRYQGQRAYPIQIEFSKNLLMTARDEFILEVIRHEMAHYFVLQDTGASHGHDQVWKAWAVKIGCYPRATLKQTILSFSQDAHYQLICEKCRQELGYYQRRGKILKNITKYRSKCCQAAIIVKNINHK
ncbi:SprT-like domain-containing protein [Ligilactobacillus ceti]|uniref:SprT-like domain-containing protein n=1 Tax=Ligilactobacillus ceti DSM 22408 TaxID=1122146 RepID=A0A0R2KSK1_9LACO|nr:SprT-like domain-containing protein [Ligilactobacillus ceti]KRN89980.1 hypothetical protein IV53_GL001098 [Ligilactobacillus ceti DSM 22408]